MSKPDYKPVPRVRMTLTGAIQDRCLHELCAAFGISESYSQTHEITCFPSDFAYFMGLVAKMEKPPSLKQLRVEYVDVRRDVMRTHVHSRNRDWSAEELVAEAEEIVTSIAEPTSEKISPSMHIIKTYPIAQALWWFIENVHADNEEHSDLFFALRGRVRDD